MKPAERGRNGRWLSCARETPRPVKSLRCRRPAARKHCESCCAVPVREPATRSEKLPRRDKANRAPSLRENVPPDARPILPERPARCVRVRLERSARSEPWNVKGRVRDRGAERKRPCRRVPGKNTCDRTTGKPLAFQDKEFSEGFRQIFRLAVLAEPLQFVFIALWTQAGKLRGARIKPAERIRKRKRVQLI